MCDFTPMPNGGAWLTSYRLDHTNNQTAINTYGALANTYLIPPNTCTYLDNLDGLRNESVFEDGRLRASSNDWEPEKKSENKRK